MLILNGVAQVVIIAVMIMGKVRGLPTNTDLGIDFSFKSLRKAVEAFDDAESAEEARRSSELGAISPIHLDSSSHNKVRAPHRLF
jgi:hypothetical protein